MRSWFPRQRPRCVPPEPDVVERDELHRVVLRRDLGRAVLKPVVDYDDLELRIAQPGRVPQALSERRGRVIGTDHTLMPGHTSRRL